MLKAPNSAFSGNYSTFLNFSSAPLSKPSDSRKMEVTLFGTFLSLTVFRARLRPLTMLVLPELYNFLIFSENSTRFYWVTVRSLQILFPS
jgi:hypothetical protein